MKPLSGREASALALLAQSPALPADEKRQVLASLNGQALKIARVLVGDDKHPTAELKAAARGLTEWAESLPAV